MTQPQAPHTVPGAPEAAPSLAAVERLLGKATPGPYFAEFVDEAPAALRWLVAEVRRLEGENAWYRSMLDDTAIRGFAVRNGAREVHRSWRENMIEQGREVAEDRMRWDTLSEQDKELDTAISIEILRDYAAYILGHKSE